WTYFLAGAKQWEADTGNTVNTSFHNGDVAAHQEAVRAAIAAGADGITTTSPDPGSLVEVAKEANAAKIPIINFNTPDPTASFDAYVGGDNVVFGRGWAQYLVDKGLVKQGRSEEHTSELQSRENLVCRLLLEKKNKEKKNLKKAHTALY